MSVEYYEFDVCMTRIGRLKLAATSRENAQEIAKGLMDSLFDTGCCELIEFEEKPFAVECFDTDGTRIYMEG